MSHNVHTAEFKVVGQEDFRSNCGASPVASPDEVHAEREDSAPERPAWRSVVLFPPLRRVLMTFAAIAACGGLYLLWRIVSYLAR